MFLTSTYKSTFLHLLLLASFSIGKSIGSPGYHGRQEDKQQQLVPHIDEESLKLNPNPHTIPELLNALDVLEEEYFEVWQGIWPKSIDWTSAVIGTYLAGALSTLSTSFEYLSSPKAGENIINKYFSQLVASYFGQNAFALRQEAYDDMLWVVLGWLDGIKFIDAHSAIHFSKQGKHWHGQQFVPAFAHRARIFWELAHQGWDTSLCDGGMLWSPYLTPYKNAITNELYISASVSMYLYFPGDSNDSPFGYNMPGLQSPTLETAMERDSPAHDPKYLAAAVEAYEWLVDSNMTDAKGLFVDGYHVSGWGRDRPREKKCDERNEMVYTYNQGVLLTGQRGLYQATGSKKYLQDGHRLISDVIAATGWDLEHDRVVGDTARDEARLGKWHGLGRSGILEEACDAGAYCSQDAQTFKGIFFHHLTAFCHGLSEKSSIPAHLQQLSVSQLNENQIQHSRSCRKYHSWIKHNAHAALTTKDDEGRFGMWWGAPQNTNRLPDLVDVVIPDKAVDYRNEGVPGDWLRQDRMQKKSKCRDGKDGKKEIRAQDLNDRGRGRTVETQGGGVSVLRAFWELVDRK